MSDSMSVSARVSASVKLNVNCKVYVLIKSVKNEPVLMQFNSLKEDSEFCDTWIASI